MQRKVKARTGSLPAVARWASAALVPLVLFLLCAVLPIGCRSTPTQPPVTKVGPSTCRIRTLAGPGAPGAAGPKTVPAGTIPGSFSITSTGEATYVMPLTTVPGRAGVEPRLSLTYDSSGEDGVLGVGFSLAGLSAITRCPQNLAQDGEIRDVRYDALDKLCLDGKRLVPLGPEAAGIIEYRTFPDTFTKVLGHYPPGGGNALSFEAHLPSGLVIEYGGSPSGLPLALGGVPRAWLATEAHDGRGNAMAYTYCSDAGDGDGYTAEYAIDEIDYTSFTGSPSLPASRAVAFVYGTKDPTDARTLYSGGMALQSSLLLEEVQMLGESNALVRRYDFTYALGPTTNRTLLTQVEECAGDGVCMPPTRFQFSSSAAGFKQVAMNILTPTSTLASPMLLDLDGDGLDDLLLPDTDKALSTPTNPITDWLVARNRGASASPPYLSTATLALSEQWPMVASPSGPADPTMIQPELGTAIDYNQDGLTDVFLHDVYDSNVNWQVLLTQPDHTFKLQDTGIARPFPIGMPPKLPNLSSPGGSAHLADVDGDGVPDLIQCQDHSEMETGDPSQAAWTTHLWKAVQGGAPAGFDVAGEPLGELAGYPCDTDLYTLDVNGDGKVDLVVQGELQAGGTMLEPLGTYYAFTRIHDGTWPSFDTTLPVPLAGGRVMFLDVNGDGLPDAVESGFGDHSLWTYFNKGTTFAPPVKSLASAGPLDEQDAFFALAVPIDYNGDGRQDLLMPVPAATLPGQSNALPAWAILQATGSQDEPTFTLVDPHVPFEPELTTSGITLADPHGPRVGDVNGDGAEDVILPLNGVFNVFQNLAPDQDLLVSVSDGMNAHDPTDPGFVPNVSFAYGHLTDASITKGTAAGDPALESDLYLSHADATNACTYPRTCAVGPRRVVSGYTTNNGADAARHFGVRYRDGRYHRLGRGFLGFGERIVTDLDTLAGTADFYDTTTLISDLDVFPLVGQVQHEWRWYPGLPSQPNPSQIELSFTDVTSTLVETNGNLTYFTLPIQHRVRREEGSYPSAIAPTIETYVKQVESYGGATVLRDTTMTVSDHDAFGNVRVVDVTTVGVDLTMHVERTFINDTMAWVLGQLQTQKVCSAAATMSQCRMLTRHTTTYGEVHDEATASDDGLPDTQLSTAYDRDPYGNVTMITASDAYGNQRLSKTTYDAEGIFPTSILNPAMQTTNVQFDARFGRVAMLTDPNQLVTSWAYDGFGRLGIAKRPDGTQTTVTLARTKDGGPARTAWRVTQRSTTTGGADDTVEVDSLGRSVRWWWYGPEPSAAARVMQEIAYDALGEHVARRSVPVSEGTAESALLNDTFEYDAMGREVLHTTPWKAVTQTAYDGLVVQVTDPLMNVTVTEQDALGRAVSVTDAAMAVTTYTYGPFGDLYTVSAPGGALTRTMRDAFGRVRQLDDPDRGTTTSTHDGFGELISSTDALGRVITYSYDGLGRTKTRVDQDSGQSLTTTWTWDTAPNGIGKLAQLTSPDGQKSYTYTPRGQLSTIALSVNGESDLLQARLGYDPSGRVSTITYPTPAGAAPFGVTQGYDAYGHVLSVTDSTTNQAYWKLTGVDSAGRYTSEVFGNGVSSTRSYFADKQSLQSIVTESGTTPVQSLTYDYDARRDLTSRTDMLQPQNTTERFRYDPVERLTCAYFSVAENDTAPCALSYGYDPSGNGNLTSKSDVGTLVYGDPKHPHAVTGAGSDSFGYDAVGNQTTRPGGATVAYTPFDLPKTIAQSSGTVTLDYDGDQHRIRKTTPEVETLYFGDLYERVTTVAPATTAHTYYIHSPERVVAVVTQGGATPGTVYVHVDHLGSVDALTNANGDVVERRSYDPFGQRRNPLWGQPPPASFASMTTVGFTGQESDDELGLVNFKGRVYDPKVGRFLTTDPIVSEPLSGQSWNSYSYVANNPLNYVDPSGFEDVPPPPDPTWDKNPDVQRTLAAGCLGLECQRPPPPPGKTVEGSREAVQSGATTRPVDVSTTGSAAGYVPQPVTTSPKSSPAGIAVEEDEGTTLGDRLYAVGQVIGGFFAGIPLGLVPGGALGQQAAVAEGTIPAGTRSARIGLAVGEIFGGAVLSGVGATGDGAGVVVSGTGVGALGGVPLVVVSTTAVVGGAANVAAGAAGLAEALQSRGSGSGSKAAEEPKPSDKRSFSRQDRAEGLERAKDADGVPRCAYCDKELSEKAGKPESYEADHRLPHSRGGPSAKENLTPSCRTCNRSKGAKTPEEWKP